MPWVHLPRALLSPDRPAINYYYLSEQFLFVLAQRALELTPMR